MVTQSVIPSMEGRVTAWNDKVGSRRRGISGRFMSLSKRFAGFGSSKPTAAGQDSSNTSGGNYDSARGLYSVDTTEAILRQLADYAFMLRDWRLAYSTYEILRTDFGNDKAWKYYAAANEMSAISLLLNPQSTSSRTRSETLDQMLESASYSYLTRCSMPLGVIRCLTIAVELLKCRGSAAVEDATRWGSKLLELNVLSSTAQAFLSERIAECYQSRIRGSGLMQACTRKRKSAFWSLLASTTWIEHGKLFQAQEPFRLAGSFYRQSGPRGVSMPFPSMEPFWDSIEHVVPDANRTLSPEFDEGSPRIGEEELFSNAESEVLDGYQPSGQNNPSGVGETNSMYNTRQADLFGFSQDK